MQTEPNDVDTPLVIPTAGAIIKASAVADEDQRHQPGADQKGKDNAKSKRDPAVNAHFDLAKLHPDPIAEYRCNREKPEENDDCKPGFQCLVPLARVKVIAPLSRPTGSCLSSLFFQQA